MNDGFQASKQGNDEEIGSPAGWLCVCVCVCVQLRNLKND